MLVSSLLLTSVLARADPEAAEDVVDTFTPPEVKHALFVDTFADGNSWTVSGVEKYSGTWSVGTVDSAVTRVGEASLIANEPARHFAISHDFSQPLTTGDGFVIQYEVRHNARLDCGGAYLKLLDTREEVQPEGIDSFSGASFSNDTPYSIMFGPDRCGTSDKVHFIIRFLNPITGEYAEKHLQNPPAMKNDGQTHVYTLLVKADNQFEVLIDLEVVASGSLLDSFEPPLNPSETIPDPDDVKPENWIDNPRMDDPEASKPLDWDEDAPQFIPEEGAVMPEGWDEEGEYLIPDPTAEQPDDWDEEDDGVWEAPSISNPVCLEVGCGPWSAPMLPNPEYKGKWHAPQVDNPEYVGPWTPQQIPNPAYFHDPNPVASLTAMGAVGIEIWTMQGEVEFDNVYIGTGAAAIEESRAFAQATWLPKNLLEEEDALAQAGGDSVVAALVDFVTENAVPVAVAVSAFVFLLVCFCSCMDGGDGDVDARAEHAAGTQTTGETETGQAKASEKESAAAAPDEDDDIEDVEPVEPTPRKRR